MIENEKEIHLSSQDSCTGCGACLQACPQKCISFVEDDMGFTYPVINRDMCISCGACLRTCHLNLDYFYPKSSVVYAGWANDVATRKNSASGGIATSIYQFALLHGYRTFGVSLNPEGEATYREIKTKDDIASCQNSKYVFSDTKETYSEIKKYLYIGEKVIFIGLPCQVAGLLGFIGGRKDNLYIVDIICHGTCPETYLQQHISCVNKKQQLTKVLFRDPAFGSNKFIFSLYKNNKRVYSSIVHGTDVYQLGYHEALIYRENCYNCRYARPERIGDITISDFSGLGKIEPWNHSRSNISCIICSTEKGKHILDKLTAAKMIQLIQRHPDEAFLYEKQLQGPSIPHPLRDEFVTGYKATKNFEEVCKCLLADEIKKNRLRMMLKKDEIRALVRQMLPKSLKERIKKVMGTRNG